MNPFLDALAWLGSSLDKPGAAVRGLVAGRPDQLANLIPFSDTMGLTDPSQRTEGADLLGLDRDSTGGMLGGMAVNVATDPLNWLLGAGLAKNLVRGRQMEGSYQTAQAGYQGELAAREALLPAIEKAQANNALRQELLASGGMPEEVAQLTKAVDESGQPVRTYHGTGSVYDRYDPALDRGANLYGRGYYTTADQGVGAGYAGSPGYQPLGGDELTAVANEMMRRARASVGHARPSAEARAALRQAHPDLPLPLPPAVPREMSPEWIKGAIPQWDAAGIPVEDLFSHHTPNVRMQHLDLRNPWSPDLLHSAEEHERLLGSAAGYAQDPGSLPAVYGQGLWDEAEAMGIQHDDLLRALHEGGYDSVMHTGGTSRGHPHQVYIAHRPEQIYSPWVAPLQMAEPALPGAYPPARPVAPRVSPMIAALLAQNSLGRTG